MNSPRPSARNVSSCWSARRHMNSSLAFSRPGVSSRMRMARSRVWSGGSMVTMCSCIGSWSRYRDQLPMHEHMVTMDPPDHTRERAILMRLLTPGRLKANEEFMWRLADQQLDTFLADGRGEFITGYAQPFAMLVVADV